MEIVLATRFIDLTWIKMHGLLEDIEATILHVPIDHAMQVIHI
jgi:hypothetical protein